MVGICYKKKMCNVVYLEALTTHEEYRKTHEVKVSLESLITYCVYKYNMTPFVSVKFIYVDKGVEHASTAVTLYDENLTFIHRDEVPWPVELCIYPVIMSQDVIITGLCAVTRHICDYNNSPIIPQEHEDGLLGFRHSCLQAPNEVSVWTKFCEVDIIRTVKKIITKDIKTVPKNLVRFEYHLKQPVRVHNVYKIARNKKKQSLKISENAIEQENVEDEKLEASGSVSPETKRTPKSRKWKSNKNPDHIIESSTKIEDLNISHEFAEGPFLTLADLVLLPSYHIIIQSFGDSQFESLLPFTYKWYKNIMSLPKVETHYCKTMSKIHFKIMSIENIDMADTGNVSLYKCDPKRHNPKKRLFTKEEDIEKSLSLITEGMELEVLDIKFEHSFNWDDIPADANPLAGHLPGNRAGRKSQQLENLVLAVLSIVKEGDLIVDFCCGSGHLGIVLAYLLPRCTIILLENKVESLFRAKERVKKMRMNNVFFYQCNLDFFIGEFDIGIGLHACGIATDLVLDKCLKVKAKFILSPCCYGSIHATDRMVYPRSNKFASLSTEQYLCIAHTADQTHTDHPLAVRGARCMKIIDSDRSRLAEEAGYKVTLSLLKPVTCTLKNNLLIGVPENKQ